MTALETKAIPLDAVTVSDNGQISGCAWVFGAPDRVGDVIQKGAMIAPDSLPMLFGHNHSDVIGVWNRIVETEEGIFVSGSLLVDDLERAREVRSMIMSGAVSGISMGFVTKTANRTSSSRFITSFEVHEISIVAVPAHRGAVITDIKSILENNMPNTNENEFENKGIEALMARLDKLEARHNRNVTVENKSADGAEEVKAFTHFLRTGVMDQKALTVSADAPAYVLAPQEVSGEFVRDLVQFSPIRAIADVRTTPSHSVLIPKRTGITNAKWVGETAARTGSEPTFDQMEIKTQELATYVDISLRMLEDSSNVESEVRLALAEDFGKKESAAFVNGSLDIEPTGFMTASGVASVKNGHATVLSADALISLMYALPAQYRGNGTWVMNGTTLSVIRKLKDGQGNYLWQPGITAGQPETILGRPVIEAIDMPDIAAAALPIVFGDFKAGYRIYDRVELEVVPDLLTQRTAGIARFHARRRVGASVVRPDAFGKLSMAA